MNSRITIQPARNGSPSVTIKGKHIISPYNPEREALRFVENKMGDKSVNAVIILGDTLGYLRNAVHEKFPEVKIAAFALHSLLKGPDGTASVWVPGSNPDIFLQKVLEEDEVAGLMMLEWIPAAEVFPDTSERCRGAIYRVISRMNANLVTTGYFGRRWIANTVANYLFYGERITPSERSGTAVVTASGPTLESSIPVLKENREKFDLWALPSSLMSLLDSDLFPDSVICSDPGHYSLLHFKSAIGRNIEIALSTPLYGVRGLWKYFLPFLFSSGSFYEEDVLGKHGYPIIPPNGTVSGTAMLLLKYLGYSRIIFAGLDFTGKDVLSHVRPHTFDAYYLHQAFRLKPLMELRQKEMMGTGRFSRQLETYREWFEGLPAYSKKGVFRLNPSPADAGIPSIEITDIRSLPSSRRRLIFRKSTLPSLDKRCLTIKQVIKNWNTSFGNYINGRASENQKGKKLAKLIGGSRYLDFIRNNDNGNIEKERLKRDNLKETGYTFLEKLQKYTKGDRL